MNHNSTYINENVSQYSVSLAERLGKLHQEFERTIGSFSNMQEEIIDVWEVCLKVGNFDHKQFRLEQSYEVIEIQYKNIQWNAGQFREKQDHYSRLLTYFSELVDLSADELDQKFQIKQHEVKIKELDSSYVDCAIKPHQLKEDKAMLDFDLYLIQVGLSNLLLRYNLYLFKLPYQRGKIEALYEKLTVKEN